MSKFIKMALLVGLGGLVVVNAEAQEVLLTSGGEAQGSAGSVSYSIGQVAYASVSTSGGSIQNGVQQIYIQSIPTSNKVADEVAVQLSVYPNPTSDILNICLSGDAPSSKQSFVMYDALGSVLIKDELINKTTEISLRNYASGMYSITIFSADQPTQSFKIIKK